MDSTIRLSAIRWHVETAGPFLTTEIFVQGCERKCPSCFNPETWSKNGGREIDIRKLADLIIENTPYKRLTIGGGEPVLHSKQLLQLISYLKQDSKKWFIMSYTGYTFEDLVCRFKYVHSDKSMLKYNQSINDVMRYVASVDVLIDGEFIAEKKMKISKFKFVGSSNQRIIDMKKSRKRGKITLWKESLWSKIKRKYIYKEGIDLGGAYCGRKFRVSDIIKRSMFKDKQRINK
jgi:anaerobic ribonucleoside-triphosphate reductase activating protein